MSLLEIGVEATRNRRIFLSGTEHLADLAFELRLPCRRFVLLIAIDASHGIPAVDATLERLLNLGCVYLAAWGPGCDWVEDSMDHVELLRQVGGGPERTIMTTEHSSDTLEEAAEFALLWAVPDDALLEGCEAVVLAGVGSDEWLNELARVARAHAIPRVI